MAMEKRLALAIKVAKEAGEKIKAARLGHFSMNYKRGTELVTNIDKEVEAHIINAVADNFANDAFLAEETQSDTQKNRLFDPSLWVIDPIDGTVNFARGHFQVAVSIAYVEQGITQFGVVYCPFYEELFIACKGQGATLNGKNIQVSDLSDPRRALIATGFPYEKENMDTLYAQIQQVLNHYADIRRVGSAACDICWVACGRLDGYYETLSPWDFAAAKLIAEEAGAKSANLADTPHDIPSDLFGEHLVISNPYLHESLYRLLKSVTY